jgi:hypothetical protein
MKNSTKFLTGLWLCVISIMFFFSCSKELEYSDGNNKFPVANAGANATVVLPLDSIILDGSHSEDPDGSIKNFLWKKVSGPVAFNIANSNALKTSVSSLVKGVYEFELKVTDGGGLFSTDTVQVRVVSSVGVCDIDNRPIIQARLVPLGNLSIGKIDMVTAAANNKVFFASGLSYLKDSTGIPIRRVDIYDINNNTWSSKDLDEDPTWRADMGIAAVNNKIFLAGGGFWGDDIYTNRVDIYEPATGTWSVASLSEARSAAAGVSTGNKVLFAGGYTGGYTNNGSNYWSSAVDIYDNTTDTWTSATLSEPRGYVAAVAAGSKIYFAGGQKNDGQVKLSDKIDEYDLLTNSWSSSTLHEPLSGMAAISAGNKVFFAGGRSNSGESGTVEILDVATGASSFDCIIPRAGLKAVLKDDNIVFFTGTGSDQRNGTHFEMYNLSTETWSTAVLDISITRAAIISVNNVIYVAGGLVNGVGSDKVWTLDF